MPSIDTDILADKRLLAKHINNIYLAKGSMHHMIFYLEFYSMRISQLVIQKIMSYLHPIQSGQNQQ